MSVQGQDISEYHQSVVLNPPGWEVCVFFSGFLLLFAVVIINLWKLYKSGSFPTPSPFPNFHFQYLQEKYGSSHSEIRQKRVAVSGQRRVSNSSRKPSLSLLDTPDGLRELGTLELMMGREPDSRGCGVVLHRSASSESVSSISSVAQTFGQDFTVGQLEVTLEVDMRASVLLVSLHQGKDLLEKEEENCPSCFISLTLIPQQISLGATQVQRNAFTVVFDERFSVPLESVNLDENSLRFSTFGVDSDEQRLTVVIAKAKNLVWTNGKSTADPFVKVYLLQDGRKISKKKTSVKRDDTNPIFNEAMIFSVPAIVLQELSLRVTVSESTEDGRGENVGHVIIGPEAGGMGITHWNQMLATLRKPVSMWHPLRRTPDPEP
ncbi:hypothetical protein DNTS_002038 [Danionella cerebrum]|uniref:C2 domain-containing protein n=1 Tax=Danionella cerebrum TaxID=2873325 RepID=A0A553NID0_9TELE|nr:hypothetical protein DNTS_002038 [Danionella translucida]